MPDEITPDEGGSKFEPITSQEDFDARLKTRLERERAKYADYDDVKAKATEHDKAVEAAKTELQKAVERAEAAESKVAGYVARDERAAWAKDITKDSTVPAHLLRGDTREELEEHFAALSEALKPQQTPTPKRTATPPGKSPQERGEPKGAAAALRAYRQGK